MLEEVCLPDTYMNKQGTKDSFKYPAADMSSQVKIFSVYSIDFLQCDQITESNEEVIKYMFKVW